MIHVNQPWIEGVPHTGNSEQLPLFDMPREGRDLFPFVRLHLYHTVWDSKAGGEILRAYTLFFFYSDVPAYKQFLDPNLWPQEGKLGAN